MGGQGLVGVGCYYFGNMLASAPHNIMTVDPDERRHCSYALSSRTCSRGLRDLEKDQRINKETGGLASMNVLVGIFTHLTQEDGQ